MVYRFILVSDEVDNFRRDITIDSDATFFELHEIILNSVGYAKDQITSFFLCDDNWSKQAEITLIDMESNLEENVYVMETCRLSELLDEEKQKLVYVFEPLTERCFFIELKEIIFGKNQEKPLVVKSLGNPPEQVSRFEEMEFSATVHTPYSDDEDFFDDDYNFDGDYDDDDFSDLSEGNPYDDY
jgi:hypothetical protein